MKNLFVVIISICSFVYGLGQSSDASPRIASFDDCEITFPSHWKYDTENPSTRFILYSEKASEDDTFSDNINLIVQDLEGREITLEEFNDLSIQEVKQYFEGVEIFENKEILLGDVAGYVLLYTAPSNGFNLKFLQAYFLHNGKSYILTFTQETDKTNQYETEGVRIMDTFRIK